MITFEGCHNHQTRNAAALKLLPVSSETREIFTDYFEAGYGTALAMQHHEEFIEVTIYFVF